MFKENLKNLYISFAENSHEFELLINEEICALKGPADVEWVNFVWGEINSKSLKEIKNFFKDYSYYLLVTEDYENNQKNLINNNHKVYTTYPEMVLNFENYNLNHTSKSNHKIVKVSDNKTLEDWVNVVFKTYGTPQNVVKIILNTLLKATNIIAFIGYYDGNPASACFINMNDTHNGLYWVAVIPEFRRKGLATDICNKAIEYSKSQNDNNIWLQATYEGVNLYKKIGFVTTKNIDFYIPQKS